MDQARIVLAQRNAADNDKELERLALADKSFAGRVVTAASERHERLILTPTGGLLGDTDDVRKVAGAASAGALAALGMGASRLTVSIDGSIPTLHHPVDGDAFKHAALVAELAIHQAAFVPLQAREAPVPMISPLKHVAVDVIPGYSALPGTSAAIEAGRALARDIGTSDPERMAPPRLADRVLEECRAAGIDVEVLDNMAVLSTEYPLLMAVARASLPVERHQPRVVRLSWSGSGPAERTVCIAGKGVTYDTGGADLKVGGSMAGLSLDKCGAGAAAGFILTCAKAPELHTRGLRVVVELGCVRNSIGSEAYVADEVVMSHAKKRVLMGNTDAEGRLVLADCLSHLRERVLEDPATYPKPTFLSIATLTGHAARSFGVYAVAIDNGAARAMGGVAGRIAAAGAALGQPLEVSSLRREDYAFVAPGSGNTPVARYGGTHDVLQSNTQSTINTMRGHQFPMAFLDIASGLSAHSAGSKTPIPYCHIDLAGSSLDMRGVGTGSPIVPLYGHFLMGLSGVASRL